MTMTSAPVTTRQEWVAPEDNPVARSMRRQFGTDYKLAIYEEYERMRMAEGVRHPLTPRPRERPWFSLP